MLSLSNSFCVFHTSGLSNGCFTVISLQAQGTKDGKPKQKVIISDCGEYVWMGKRSAASLNDDEGSCVSVLRCSLRLFCLPCKYLNKEPLFKKQQQHVVVSDCQQVVIDGCSLAVKSMDKIWFFFKIYIYFCHSHNYWYCSFSVKGWHLHSSTHGNKV